MSSLETWQRRCERSAVVLPVHMQLRTDAACQSSAPVSSTQECLEDNSDESGFSADCKDELENLIAKVQGV